MNIKTKWSLVALMHNFIPFTMMICAPYVGLHAKNHQMRLVQIFAGIILIAFLSTFDYFGYQREKRIKAVFADIRGRFAARQADTVFVSEDELQTIGGRRG